MIYRNLLKSDDDISLLTLHFNRLTAYNHLILNEILCWQHLACNLHQVVRWRLSHMIHISETTNDDNSITIEVDGRLNRKSLASLRDVCDRHFKSNKKILLHLKGITHTDESGREYIKNLKDRVEFLSVPEFLKLEINLKLIV